MGGDTHIQLVMIDRLEAYRTYAVALKIPSGDVSTRDESGALWWDLADPYHYVRVTPHPEPGYSLLVVGGEDEKVGQHGDYAERYQRLEAWTRERWPAAQEVSYRWSGQVMDSQDGWVGLSRTKGPSDISIAYIGLNPGTKNVYVHSRSSSEARLTYSRGQRRRPHVRRNRRDDPHRSDQRS